MDNKSIVYGIVGLVVGALISGFVFSNQTNKTEITTQPSSTMQEMDHGADSMTNMVNSLKAKTGDEFDKTFISEMIIHHQGAIDMANLAKQNAKHDEVKTMADDIISAQTKEINQMKQWQKEWGY